MEKWENLWQVETLLQETMNALVTCSAHTCMAQEKSYPILAEPNTYENVS